LTNNKKTVRLIIVDKIINPNLYKPLYNIIMTTNTSEKNLIPRHNTKTPHEKAIELLKPFGPKNNEQTTGFSEAANIPQQVLAKVIKLNREHFWGKKK
jgi:hypothetical protein